MPFVIDMVGKFIQMAEYESLPINRMGPNGEYPEYDTLKVTPRWVRGEAACLGFSTPMSCVANWAIPDAR